jgi:hypothetical protein
MFVINNPKGTHLWLFSKKFQQTIFFICMIYPVYGKGKLNWPSLPRSTISIVVLLYKSLPRWSQFLFLKHIFLFSFLFQFLVWNYICSLLQVFFIITCSFSVFVENCILLPMSYKWICCVPVYCTCMVLIFYPFTQIFIISHKGTIFSQNNNSVSECIFFSGTKM